LQGLNALYLGAVDHPDTIELLSVNLASPKKSPHVVNAIA